MCIIIVNRAGNFLDSKILDEACRVNSDGFGLMYAIKNKLHIYKTLDSKLFIERYYKIKKEHENLDIILHARIGTSGLNNIANCHPFHVNDKLGFCHNGILTDFSLAKSELSDTQIFNRQMLKKLPNGFIYSKEIQSLLKSFIGYGNKLAFMDNKGKVIIINESAGNTNKSGDWFSNYSYKVNERYNYSNCDYYPSIKSFYKSDLINWNKETNDYKVHYLNREGKNITQNFKTFQEGMSQLNKDMLNIKFGDYITWNKGKYQTKFVKGNISTMSYFNTYNEALDHVINKIHKDKDLLNDYLLIDFNTERESKSVNALIPFIDLIDNYCQYCGTELTNPDTKLLQTCPNCFQANHYNLNDF